MKVKVYPLEKPIKSIDAYSSFYCSIVEIICASLAKGTSIITNVSYGKSIEMAIKWCEKIGAIIIKEEGKLTITGVNNKINFKRPLFECDNEKVGKLFIPLLSSVPFPIGIKGDERLLNKLSIYEKIYSAYGIEVYNEDGMIRYEKKMNGKEMTIEEDVDFYFITGLLLAFPLLEEDSKLIIKASSEQRNYSLLIRILARFGIEIKYRNNSFEVRGGQRYKSCRIATEIDRLLFSYNALLPSLNDESIRINNYNHSGIMYDESIFDYCKKKLISITVSGRKVILRKKHISRNRSANFEVTKSLPLLMAIGAINKNDFTISNIQFNNYHVKEGYEIMKEAFDTIKIPTMLVDNSILIGNNDANEKVQVDCKGDPYCLIALVYLALNLKEPLIIKNAECYSSIYDSMFEILKKSGIRMEFIYD